MGWDDSFDDGIADELGRNAEGLGDAVTYERKVRCIRETAEAILVQEGGRFGAMHWVPKSVLHDDSEVYKEGDAGKLVVKEWWADDNEWFA